MNRQGTFVSSIKPKRAYRRKDASFIPRLSFYDISKAHVFVEGIWYPLSTVPDTLFRKAVLMETPTDEREHPYDTLEKWYLVNQCGYIPVKIE